MRKSKAMKVIEEVALKEGLSVSEVRKEMTIVLDIAYENRRDNKLFWQRWKGKKPTLEQFLLAMRDETVSRLNFKSKL
jgi:hypothetical protein